MKRVTFDFETRSTVELKKSGGFKYSRDPSTQPTCLAFKLRGHPTVYFLPFEVVNRQWEDLPENLKLLWVRLIKEGYEFSGHNVFFDRCIYENILVSRYGWPVISAKKFRCTAAKAAACALPRNLEGAGAALNLSTQKDKRGYAAMMKTCKPTKQWNDYQKALQQIQDGKTIRKHRFDMTSREEPPMFLEPEDDPQIWQTLYTYCKIDVRTEELLDEFLPDLNPQEQEIWHLNQELNWRGLRIDLPTVKKIVSMMEVESKKKLKELDKLTMGLVTKPGARRSILEFLALDGIELPDLKAKTVEDNLKGFSLTEDMRRLLEIRKALTMTSTKKYYAFLNRVDETDERVRDILMYHGASTGRDTGTGVQPHNFPRGLIKVDKKRPYAAVENVANLEPEWLEILYGSSLAVLFSSILRNMIIPSPGYELFVADFSKVEVAVCWWLADNWPGLKILTDGGDPYITLAAMNTKKKYEEIDPDGDDRQLAKHQILGCQFGMGWQKFQTTGWDLHRLKLTDQESAFAVAQYRKLFPAVPKLWEAYEEAAVAAIETGQPQEAGKCKFFVEDNFLWVELPSKRRLAYRDPQIAWRVREYDKVTEVDGVRTVIKVRTEPMKTIEFWSVNSKTKKWNLERTWGGVLTENITQAVARDLMMPAMVRSEKRGYRALLMIHDEGLTEKKIGEGSVDEFISILCEVPEWGQGLPIEAKGWRGPRYRK